MNIRLLSLATLLVAAAFIAIGCGGSDDPSSDSNDAPTKSAYIKEADGICTNIRGALVKIVKDLPRDIEAPKAQTAITDKILPIYRQRIDDLRDLTPPEGDGDTTAAIYDSVDDALDTVEDDPSALADPGTFADASEKAVDYGLGVCGG